MVRRPKYLPKTVVGVAQRRVTEVLADGVESATSAALERLFSETADAVVRFERLHPDAEVSASYSEVRIEVNLVEFSSQKLAVVTAYRTISFG